MCTDNELSLFGYKIRTQNNIFYVHTDFYWYFAERPQFSEADLARSLLFTISNDIGHIASLYATVHNMDKVYFGGYFLRNHPLSMHTISYSIKYWSHVSFYFSVLSLSFFLNRLFLVFFLSFSSIVTRKFILF